MSLLAFWYSMLQYPPNPHNRTHCFFVWVRFESKGAKTNSSIAGPIFVGINDTISGLDSWPWRTNLQALRWSESDLLSFLILKSYVDTEHCSLMVFGVLFLSINCLVTHLKEITSKYSNCNQTFVQTKKELRTELRSWNTGYSNFWIVCHWWLKLILFHLRNFAQILTELLFTNVV